MPRGSKVLRPSSPGCGSLKYFQSTSDPSSVYQIDASWTFGGMSGAARLEQEDPDGRILGQPVGDDAAGGAGPDDDVVELVHGAAPQSSF